MGKNRDWGYASYDCEQSEDEDPQLTYTSYEESDRVNRYTDNGDGGHSHSSWESSESYDSGEDPDFYRSESNDSSNPSSGDVQDNGGCYLTTACMVHYKNHFDDNCYELTVLRWFRDNYVTKKDIEHYKNVAPQIVCGINQEKQSSEIYSYIYDTIIDSCVENIENGQYIEAYNLYKDSILNLEKVFIKQEAERE